MAETNKRPFQIQAVNRRFVPFESGLWDKLYLRLYFNSFVIEKEKEWKGPFFFVQGADCQPGLTDQWTGTIRKPYVPGMAIK